MTTTLTTIRGGGSRRRDSASSAALWLGIVSVAAVTAGCGHGRVLPAPSANQVPGAATAAFDEEQGIRVAVDGADWKGTPADLPERLTPIKVRLVNHSGHPVQILYERFTLLGGSGRTYRPLPVVPLDHASAGGVHLLPIFAAANFFVGPRYHDVYPTFDAWPDPLQRDDQFYEKQYRRWGKLPPTPLMQRSALPEGVLADGGEMSGYLYFQNATRSENKLKFQAQLVEGHGADVVANIELPLRVE